jgi:hypothetical protein
MARQSCAFAAVPRRFRVLYLQIRLYRPLNVLDICLLRLSKTMKVNGEALSHAIIVRRIGISTVSSRRLSRCHLLIENGCARIMLNTHSYVAHLSKQIYY